MLEPEVLEAIDSVQVDPEVARKDNGNFLFLNLETLDVKFRIPPNDRKRVNREKLRRALLVGVKDHVHWSKNLVEVVLADDGKCVTGIFKDGSSASGTLLVGADGSNSRTRKILRPDDYKNTQLPIRFVGSAIDMTPAQVQPLRDLDPLLFQGCHPETGDYLWFSILEVPDVNGTQGTGNDQYRVQINVSWPVKGPEDEVKPSDAERLAEMKGRAANWAPVLKAAVNTIPDGEPVQEITLADWPCHDWDNREARLTLIGDAAHAMTMYRGEGANHGILDAFHLVGALEAVSSGRMSRKAALDDFEDDMRKRTSVAVLLSRQACLDAHDWSSLNADSAILKRRAIAAK